MFLRLPLLLAVLLLGQTLTAAPRPQRLGTIDATLTDLTVAPGQRIIVTDRTGGKRDKGRILELRHGRFTTLHSFRGYDGTTPTKLTTSRSKTFGITQAGGRHNLGVLFEVTRNGIRVRHHFTEESGYPTTLKADGRTVYGAAQNGTFAFTGGKLEFLKLPLTYDTARHRGSFYAIRSIYSGVWQLQSDAEPVRLPAEDSVSWFGNFLWLPSKGDILSVSTYGGTYGEGAVRLWNPSTGIVRRTFDFQTFNGGNPTTAALSPRGPLFTGNTEGIWKISKRPKKISSITPTAIHFAGRNLYVIRNEIFADAEIWFIRNPR